MTETTACRIENQFNVSIPAETIVRIRRSVQSSSDHGLISGHTVVWGGSDRVIDKVHHVDGFRD